MQEIQCTPYFRYVVARRSGPHLEQKRPAIVQFPDQSEKTSEINTAAPERNAPELSRTLGGHGERLLQMDGDHTRPPLTQFRPDIITPHAVRLPISG